MFKQTNLLISKQSKLYYTGVMRPIECDQTISDQLVYFKSSCYTFDVRFPLLILSM